MVTPAGGGVRAATGYGLGIRVPWEGGERLRPGHLPAQRLDGQIDPCHGGDTPGYYLAAKVASAAGTVRLDSSLGWRVAFPR